MAYPSSISPFYSTTTSPTPPSPFYPSFNPPFYSTYNTITAPPSITCFTHGYSPPSHNAYTSSTTTYSTPSYSTLPTPTHIPPSPPPNPYTPYSTPPQPTSTPSPPSYSTTITPDVAPSPNHFCNGYYTPPIQTPYAYSTYQQQAQYSNPHSHPPESHCERLNQNTQKFQQGIQKISQALQRCMDDMRAIDEKFQASQISVQTTFTQRKKSHVDLRQVEEQELEDIEAGEPESHLKENSEELVEKENNEEIQKDEEEELKSDLHKSSIPALDVKSLPTSKDSKTHSTPPSAYKSVIKDGELFCFDPPAPPSKSPLPCPNTNGQNPSVPIPNLTSFFSLINPPSRPLTDFSPHTVVTSCPFYCPLEYYLQDTCTIILSCSHSHLYNHPAANTNPNKTLFPTIVKAPPTCPARLISLAMNQFTLSPGTLNAFHFLCGKLQSSKNGTSTNDSYTWPWEYNCGAITNSHNQACLTFLLAVGYVGDISTKALLSKTAEYHYETLLNSFSVTSIFKFKQWDPGKQNKHLGSS